MYHRKLKIFIATENHELENVLKEARPLDGFSHEVFCQPDAGGVDLNGYRLIILDFDTLNTTSLEKIIAEKEEPALVVGCFSPEGFPVLAEHYPRFDQVWIKPFDQKKVQSSFLGILSRLKDQEDALLTRKYLDTMIDSLPDLIWFKDAKGAHLKVNNSFCRAVNKSKDQIEGRGHYYIWDLEPEDYDQGEYICLESEEIVLQKKETCLFDETVKCGDELRKFKTYKSPVFDTDASVMGTVGVAHDVTDLQNLLIELNILIESLPFALIIADRERTITSVNQRFLDIFILDRAEVINRSIDTLLDETKGGEGDQRWVFDGQKNRIQLMTDNRVLKIQEEALLDIFGNLAGHIQLFMDITLESRLLEEKKKLEKAIEEIKQLSGLLPICASCKKIRDDKGYWKQIEFYISEHSEAEFSHGMCPDCSEKYYRDQSWYKKMKAQQDTEPD